MSEQENFPDTLEEAETIDSMMQIPSELPVLPLRDIVIYPFMIVPLFVSRDKSIRAVEEALSQNRMILLVSQKMWTRKTRSRRIYTKSERAP